MEVPEYIQVSTDCLVAALSPQQKVPGLNPCQN